MTIEQAYQNLLTQLYTIYDDRESSNITNWVIEHITGFSKIDRIINKQFELNTSQQQQLENYIQQLLEHVPVQYVLQEAWFCGYKFYVDKNVLIPRPETEELVEWMVKDYQKEEKKELHIIDVGTGSGCIAIALKKKIPSTKITAIDISNEALVVAKQNALQLEVDIDFIQNDFLNKNTWNQLPIPSILISNPPYIPVKEKEKIRDQVKFHEPSNALFVPNENSLIFYEAIAHYALKYMKAGSTLYAEIHENYGKEVYELWKNLGLNPELKKDMQEKDRMIKAII